MSRCRICGDDLGNQRKHQGRIGQRMVMRGLHGSGWLRHDTKRIRLCEKNACLDELNALLIEARTMPFEEARLYLDSELLCGYSSLPATEKPWWLGGKLV